MTNIDVILHMDKFDDLSKNNMLDIIHILKNELKYLKYRNEGYFTTYIDKIKLLENKEYILRQELERLKEVNNNYRSYFSKKLSLRERITGRIK